MTEGRAGPYCPQCSQPATGNFCQQCGAKLGGRFCNQCGSKVAAGAKFCNQCGNELAGGGGGGRGVRAAAAAAALGGQNLAWWVAGAAMFALIMFIGVSMVRPAGPAAPSAPAGPAAAGGAPPDITQMTPIEAADRLFERVMTAVSAGDSAEAQGFLPMAVAAYERARPLDLDGLFHLSLLNRTAMNAEAALDNARAILEEDPDHLLGLAAAAEAAIELGLLDEAETHYRHLLDVYDAEVGRELDEYIAHARIVEALKQDAERFLAGR